MYMIDVFELCSIVLEKKYSRFLDRVSYNRKIFLMIIRMNLNVYMKLDQGEEKQMNETSE